ncbi:MAG: tRNA (adenosine(37)-N6)-dimethylallyltransferase MiaA [Chloroflexi bacterium]|nr:tRNA (adenosine(37)-N6)-dimethylallyltransferase MiaA [Chloroflexota bacterium]
MTPLLVIVGPTGIGKTALSLALARFFPVEIISADSRLFYQGMDIGTAKPTPEEQALVPHHLIDICTPAQTMSLGEYQEQAQHLIHDIHQRGRLPILLGGTGQYVWAVVEGWGIPRVPPQPALRAALESLGQSELSRWLQQLDPAAAATLDLHNTRRIIRALEVTLVSGIPMSRHQEKHPPPYHTLILGLTCGRETLYRRIDERVDNMIAAGLVDELESLRQAGYGRHLPAMSGLGYRQLWPYLDGEQTLAEAVERIKFETHRFVRHQNNWFKPDDPRIHWLDIEKEDVVAAARQKVASFLVG